MTVGAASSATNTANTANSTPNTRRTSAADVNARLQLVPEASDGAGR